MSNCALSSSHENDVFINCPFDQRYTALIRPLLFTVLYVGCTPRLASERFNSGEERLGKICELIQSSRLSIHDISRAKSEKKGEILRMNMPFELGIDFGCRLFGGNDKRNKVFLVLEREKHACDKALSDFSGMDVKNHNDNPEELVREVRNWFVENGMASNRVPATRIWDDFNEFMADFYTRRKNEGFNDKDLQMMPIPEYIDFTRAWLSAWTPATK